MSYTDTIRLTLGDIHFCKHCEKQLIHTLNFRNVTPLVGIYHKEIITSKNKFNMCIYKDAQETVLCNNEILVIS